MHFSTFQERVIVQCGQVTYKLNCKDRKFNNSVVQINCMCYNNKALELEWSNQRQEDSKISARKNSNIHGDDRYLTQVQYLECQLQSMSGTLLGTCCKMSATMLGTHPIPDMKLSGTCNMYGWNNTGRIVVI